MNDGIVFFHQIENAIEEAYENGSSTQVFILSWTVFMWSYIKFFVQFYYHFYLSFGF